MPNIFITGVSSGIGLGLVKKYLEKDWAVYGVSRRPCPLTHKKLHSQRGDLTDSGHLPDLMYKLLSAVKELDLVILNAGILGELADMKDTSLSDLKRTMEVNLWCNKTLLDWLFKHVKTINQVVAISSGAAVNGSRGWNGYAISKAALNMMVKLYSTEQKRTHFTSLAPGLVDTAMQDYLSSLKEIEKYPSLKRIQSSKGTDNMPAPDQLADRLPDVFRELKKYDSGSFVDIRKM